MKRKAIQLASKTLVISLPSKWAKMHGVVKGAELEVEERKGSIVVSPGSIRKRGMKSSIDISGFDSSLVWHNILALYRAGADEIEICFDEPEIYDARTKKKTSILELVQRISNRLVGMEVVRHGKNFCVLKELSSAKEDEFGETMRRAFLLLMGMAEDLLAGIKNNDDDLLTSVWMHSDNQLDKMVDFCMRIINTSKLGSLEALSKHQLLMQAEQIGDCYAWLAKELAGKKQEKEIVLVVENLNRFVRLFYELCFECKREKLVELNNEKIALRKKFSTLKEQGCRIADICETIIRLAMEAVGYQIMVSQIVQKDNP